MNQLHDLLDSASTPTSADAVESPHDLDRVLTLGRRSLRRRRIAAAGGGIAAATIAVGAVVGGAALFGEPAKDAPAISVAAAPTTSLVDVDLAANGYHVAKLPQGWEKGAQAPDFNALFVPSTGGGFDADPMGSFAGKIVVTCGAPTEGPVGVSPGERGGFTVRRDETINGEPSALVVQVPKTAGLTSAQAGELADGVTITGTVSCVAG